MNNKQANNKTWTINANTSRRLRTKWCTRVVVHRTAAMVAAVPCIEKGEECAHLPAEHTLLQQERYRNPEARYFRVI